MKILLVAATKMEVEPFLNKMNQRESNETIEPLICGIGIASTVYQLTRKLLNNHYDLVIQAGIAGSFTKKIKKGEVVLVRQDAFTGPAILENGEFKTPFFDENEFPFLGGRLVNTNEVLKETHLRIVNAVTTDVITDEKKQNKKMRKTFAADIESMEGAALHYVCLQQRVPFLQLRAISNKVGVRDKTKWKIKTAIDNLTMELNKLLNDYK
jgi:Nucleoside phosphorylase